MQYIGIVLMAISYKVNNSYNEIQKLIMNNPDALVTLVTLEALVLRQLSFIFGLIHEVLLLMKRI